MIRSSVQIDGFKAETVNQYDANSEVTLSTNDGAESFSLRLSPIALRRIAALFLAEAEHIERMTGTIR